MLLPLLLGVYAWWVSTDACLHPLQAVVACLAFLTVAGLIGRETASLILPDAPRQTSGSPLPTI